jgi:hypothetical protein
LVTRAAVVWSSAAEIVLSYSSEEAGALGGDELADDEEYGGEGRLGGVLRFAKSAEQEKAE